MGLGNGVHWVSWFVDSFALMGFSSLLLRLAKAFESAVYFSRHDLCEFNHKI